jgi:hypothetical protein
MAHTTINRRAGSEWPGLCSEIGNRAIPKRGWIPSGYRLFGLRPYSKWRRLLLCRRTQPADQEFLRLPFRNMRTKDSNSSPRPGPSASTVPMSQTKPAGTVPGGAAHLSLPSCAVLSCLRHAYSMIGISHFGGHWETVFFRLRLRRSHRFGSS